MTAGFSDNYQKSGWGVSDGEQIIKNGKPYSSGGWQGVSRLNPDNVWIGHVRAASPNTAISNKEAHPFALANGFVGVHNGFFDGTDKSEFKAREPDSDSYRAFASLSYLMQANTDNIISIVESQWLPRFYQGSKFVVGIANARIINFFRHDEDRTLFYARVGNGFLICTTLDMIEFVRDRAVRYNIVVGQTREINTYSAYVFLAGSSLVQNQELDYQLAAIPNEVLARRAFEKK